MGPLSFTYAAWLDESAMIAFSIDPQRGIEDGLLQVYFRPLSNLMVCARNRKME
jgi:hypothetical protein